MTLDTRARRAAQGIHRAVEVMEMSLDTQTPRKVDRFDDYRERKIRNRRLGAVAVGIAVVLGVIVAGASLLRSESVPTGGPGAGPHPLAGTWRTPELSRDQLIEATRAAGCTQQQADDFFATYPAETLVVTLRLRADGTWQESQAIDGGPATKGSEGDWVENGGQLVLSEGGSGAGDIVLDYAIEGGRLSMDVTSPTCAENVAAPFLFETAPFTRVAG